MSTPGLLRVRVVEIHPARAGPVGVRAALFGRATHDSLVPMNCAACGAENRETARFCRACGTPLARTCPNGHAVDPDALYCDICGEPVAEAPTVDTKPSSERRLGAVPWVERLERAEAARLQAIGG